MLADFFGLSSESQVSYILRTWIPYLELGPLLVRGTHEEVQAHTYTCTCMPVLFKSDAVNKSCRVVIDCFIMYFESHPCFETSLSVFEARFFLFFSDTKSQV